jgi:phage terminase large subunit-like protein
MATMVFTTKQLVPQNFVRCLLVMLRKRANRPWAWWSMMGGRGVGRAEAGRRTLLGRGYPTMPCVCIRRGQHAFMELL